MSALDFGRLDRKITIEEPTKETKNDLGEEPDAWDTFKEVWATVTQGLGREFTRGQEIAENRAVFTTHCIPGVKKTFRVDYNGVKYDIFDVRELGRGDGLEIHAVANDEG